MKRFPAVLLVSAIVLSALMSQASAAGVAGDTINQVLSDYHNGAQRWEATIAQYATGLFWALAFIELLWLGIRLVLRAAEFGEFVTEVVQFILFVGFFYALLLNGSTWANDIVTSFVQAGNSAAVNAGGVSGLTPATVLQDGIDIVSKLWNTMGFTTPGYDVELVMIGLAVLITLGVITAYMCEALIESYLVITAGILFFGFGGSRWTKDFAVKILTYAISVGAKLFFLELIVALGLQFINQYVTNTPTQAPGFAELVGVLVTMLALVVMIPSMVQSLVNGSAFSAGGALLGAAGAAAAAVAGGAAALGTAGYMGASRELASITPNASPMARIGAALRGAGRGLAGDLPMAATRDLGRRLSGQPFADLGTMGGRMSADMAARMGGKPPPQPPGPPQSQPSGISGA